MSEIKTNACEFLSGQKEQLELSFSYKIRSKIYSLIRRFVTMDEFDWGLYCTISTIAPRSHGIIGILQKI